MTTTTTAILTPVVLILVAIVVQTALYLHGVQRAEAAADSGARAAAAAGGSAATGESAARTFLAGAPLEGAAVAVERGDDTTTVRVTGETPRLVPLISWNVAVEATAPTERFVAENDRT